MLSFFSKHWWPTPLSPTARSPLTHHLLLCASYHDVLFLPTLGTQTPPFPVVVAARAGRWMVAAALPRTKATVTAAAHLRKWKNVTMFPSQETTAAAIANRPGRWRCGAASVSLSPFLLLPQPLQDPLLEEPALLLHQPLLPPQSRLLEEITCLLSLSNKCNPL